MTTLQTPTTTWEPTAGGRTAASVSTTQAQRSSLQETSEQAVQPGDQSRWSDSVQISKTASEANGNFHSFLHQNGAPLYTSNGVGKYIEPRTAGVNATLFNSVDSDHNGVVTRSELRSMSANFDAADRNHDGYITRNELVGEAAGTSATGPQQHISVAA